jgi:hypothetical protein
LFSICLTITILVTFVEISGLFSEESKNANYPCYSGDPGG